MIIPFKDIESTPDYHSPGYNHQVCYYKTSDDESTPVISEYTKFPNIYDFKSEIMVTYSVYFGEFKEEDFVPDNIPNNAIFKMCDEPFYNEKTKQCDIWVGTLKFKTLEEAYEYAISKEIK